MKRKRDGTKHILCNCEWRHNLSMLPLESRAKVYDAIFEYVETGEIPDLELVEKVAFEPIKKEVERYVEHYNQTCESRQKAALAREEQKRLQSTTNDHKEPQKPQETTNDHKEPQKPQETTNTNTNTNSKSNINNKDINMRNLTVSSSNQFDADDGDDGKIAKSIVIFYNTEVENKKARLRKCVRLTPKREGHILARAKEYGVDKVKEVINKAIQSNFLNYDATNAPVDLEWLMLPNNFLKILEDKYINKPAKGIAHQPQNGAELGRYHIDMSEGKFDEDLKRMKHG